MYRMLKKGKIWEYRRVPRQTPNRQKIHTNTYATTAHTPTRMQLLLTLTNTYATTAHTHQHVCNYCSHTNTYATIAHTHQHVCNYCSHSPTRMQLLLTLTNTYATTAHTHQHVCNYCSHSPTHKQLLLTLTNTYATTAHTHQHVCNYCSHSPTHMQLLLTLTIGIYMISIIGYIQNPSLKATSRIRNDKETSVSMGSTQWRIRNTEENRRARREETFIKGVSVYLCSIVPRFRFIW